MSVSYLRAAQIGFAGLVAAGRAEAADAVSAEVLDDLDVVRDRAMSAVGKAQAEALRAHAADVLAAARAEPGDVGAAAVQAEFEPSSRPFADDGFRYRRRVGEIMAGQVRRTFMAIGASLPAALAITVLVSRLIAPPVRRAVRIAQAIAAGNLDNPIRATGRGETADLLRALSAMQDAIRGQIERIEALMREQERAHGEQRSRQAEMDQLVDQFATGLGGVFRGVSGSAQRMSDLAGEFAGAAEEIAGPGQDRGQGDAADGLLPGRAGRGIPRHGGRYPGHTGGGGAVGGPCRRCPARHGGSGAAHGPAA